MRIWARGHCSVLYSNTYSYWHRTFLSSACKTNKKCFSILLIWRDVMNTQKKIFNGVCLWCERYNDHHNEHYNWQLQRSLRLNIMVDTKTDQQSHDHSDHYNYYHSWHSNWLPQWPPWLIVTETTTISHPSDLINDDHGWPPQ